MACADHFVPRIAITQYFHNENTPRMRPPILSYDKCMRTSYAELNNARKPIVMSFEYYASSISYFFIYHR